MTDELRRPLAADLDFLPLSAHELVPFLERTRVAYVAHRIEAGDSPREAAENARRSLERLFPGDQPAAGQLVGWVMRGACRVAELWIGPADDDPARWWVWNVAVEEELRGRGYGRATMLLAERLARAAGVTSIGLNVLADNTVARRLYAALGYEETSVQMRKDITA